MVVSTLTPALGLGKQEEIKTMSILVRLPSPQCRFRQVCVNNKALETLLKPTRSKRIPRGGNDELQEIWWKCGDPLEMEELLPSAPYVTVCF